MAAKKTAKKPAAKKPAAKPAAKPAKKAAPKPVKKAAAKPAPKAPAKPALKPAPRVVVKKAIKPHKPAGPSPVEVVRELSDAELKAVKTGLTKKDLDYFRRLLMELRTEIVGDVLGMEEALQADAGNLSHVPLHMADSDSDSDFHRGLMESERQMLHEIDEALVRIDAGTYGVCMDSGVPIDRKRLEAKPWAKLSIDAARRREKTF